MLEFAGGMKSIRSALLNLVELGPGNRQIGPILWYILVYTCPSATCFTSPTYDSDNKVNQKIMKLTKIFKEKGQSDASEKRVM